MDVGMKNKATITQRRGHHEQRAGDPTNEDKGDRKVDVTQPGGRSVTVLKTRRKRKVDKADTMGKGGFRHATRKTERIITADAMHVDSVKRTLITIESSDDRRLK